MKVNKSFRPVLIALSVMLLGLFMLCAHNQTIETPGEDLAGGDDEFRQELLDMLDLSSGDSTAQEFAAGDASLEQPGENSLEGSGAASESEEMSGDDQADLMALLAGVEEPAKTEEAAAPAGDEPPVEMATALPSQLQATDIADVSVPEERSVAGTSLDDLHREVKRLEVILEQRSEQVDSLRRIIDNRSARLADLENRKATGYPMAASAPMPTAAQEKQGAQTTIRVAQGSYANKYNEARSEFESFNYNGCIETMDELLNENSNSPLADNAQYWIGESYFGLKQYQKAILEFQKVFSFNATDKYDDAQLMIGLCYVRLGQQEMARSTFGDFLQTYEGSEYRGVAQKYYQNI